MRATKVFVALMMTMTALIPLMMLAPSVGAQPPLTGDWVITTAESLSGGTYEVHDGDIIIQDGGSLTLDGTEIRMDDTTWPVYHVEVQSGGTLIMRNDALIRSEYNNSNHYYFWIRAGAKVRITDSNVSDVGITSGNWDEHGIFIQSDDVVIDHSDITRGGYGLMVVESSPTITNNTIYDNTGYGIYSELGDATIVGNTIRDNGNGGYWWANWHGIGLYNAQAFIDRNVIENNGWNGANYGSGIYATLSNATITNNTIRNSAEHGIGMDDHSNIKAADNVIRGNDGTGIGVWDHSNAVLINNDVYTNGFRGLYITGSSEVEAIGNYINTTDSEAVYITGYSTPTLKENTIRHHGSGLAVRVRDDSVVVFKGNDIYSENDVGMQVQHWSKATITGNTFNANTVALEIWEFSEAAIIDNVITSRTGNGLGVGYYSWAYVMGNVISSRWEGFEIWSYSYVQAFDTDVTSNNDIAVEVRRSTLHMESSNLVSNTHYGLYNTESEIDIINSTITALNNRDIYFGTSSASYPAYIMALNTTFNQSDVQFENSQSRLDVFWYAEKIWVEWQNEREVPGADVAIQDLHGATAYTGTADKNGEINWLPVMEYTQNRSTRDDKTRHNFSAEMNGVHGFAGANVNKNVKIRIILQDNINDPLIYIENPVDGGIYNTSVVWANGTAFDPESAIYSVTVEPQGLAAVLANGTDEWGTHLTLPDGVWLLTVKAVNYAGVEEFEEVTITVDTVPPSLAVAYPAIVDLLNTTNVTFSGTTEPGAIVTVNGLDAPVDGDGNFALNVTLPEGVNTVTVAARDEALNWNYSIHTITVDITPPPLVVFTPDKDIITTESPILTAGWVEAGAYLTLNDDGVPHVGEPFSVSVDLVEGHNQLTFVAMDEAGNTATVVRTVTYDISDPEVNVTNPPEDILTNTTVLNVSGWTHDLTPDTITVNGVDVTADSDGNFSLLVNLTEGMNEIEVIVRDKAGHFTIIRRMVELDTIAPPLDVFTPLDGLLTNVVQLMVVGTTELGASVTVNGGAAPLDADGVFQYTYTLSEGDNTITIVAQDPAGNPTSIVRHVQLDTTPPALKVSSPKKGDSFNEIELEVKGTVSDEVALAKFTINGKEVAVKNGKFSTILALKAGDNKIVVKAVDTAGNEVVEEVKVTREGLTTLEGGLLGLGIIFLIVGLLLGLFMGRGKRKKGPAVDLAEEDEGEEGPVSDAGRRPMEDDLDEDIDDDVDDDMDDEVAEGGKEDATGGTSSEDETPPEGMEREDRGAEEGPSGKPDEEGPKDRKPEGQEAEGEAPPDDTAHGGSKKDDPALDGILQKLKK